MVCIHSYILPGTSQPLGSPTGLWCHENSVKIRWCLEMHFRRHLCVVQLFVLLAIWLAAAHDDAAQERGAVILLHKVCRWLGKPQPPISGLDTMLVFNPLFSITLPSACSQCDHDFDRERTGSCISEENKMAESWLPVSQWQSPPLLAEISRLHPPLMLVMVGISRSDSSKYTTLHWGLVIVASPPALSPLCRGGDGDPGCVSARRQGPRRRAHQPDVLL